MITLSSGYGFGAPAPARKPAPKIVAKPVAKKPAPRAAMPTRQVVAARPKVATVTAKPKPVPNPGVIRLQHTLNSLAQRLKDGALTVKVDGFIGPKTVASANRALVRYATTASPALRSGRLTAAQVVSSSGNLAALFETIVTKTLPKAKAAPAPKKVAAVKSSSIMALQRALRALGAAAKDSTLRSIKPDGLIGPKTTAATNRALTKFVASASPLYKTGTLTAVAVVSAAPELTAAVQGEISRRGAPRSVPDEGTEGMDQDTPEPRVPATSSRDDDPDMPRIKIPGTLLPGEKEPSVTVPQPQVPTQLAPPSDPDRLPPEQTPPEQTPPEQTPPAEAKPFPWVWVAAGGAGVVGIVAAAVLLSRKKRR